LTPETPQADVYTPSPVPNRVNSWTYDNNGNIQTIPLVTNAYRSFTYDAENRTATATIVDGATTTSASYVYDGLGQRVSETVNGVTTNPSAETSPTIPMICHCCAGASGKTRLALIGQNRRAIAWLMMATAPPPLTSRSLKGRPRRIGILKTSK
jgi:YD repeat-containing protein